MGYMGFVNLTPFCAEQMALMDQNGRDLLVYVVKGTYAMDAGPDIVPAEKQPPVLVGAQYYGEPDQSSIKYESEAAFDKKGTDVVLIGHAYAPAPDAPHVDVTLEAGPLSKTVRVFGDRFWVKRLTGWSITQPLPFRKIPLVYEQAFGGWDRSHPDPDKHTFYGRNPVGRGYHARGAKARQGDQLPNLEDPRELIRRPRDTPFPAGFGFIAPNWDSRLRYCGTYDDSWQQNRMPLLPKDFDLTFFNAAHPDLIADAPFSGGEPIAVYNASKQGPLRFNLPRHTPEAVVMMHNRDCLRTRLTLDTVIINTDDNRLHLIWRGNILVHNRLKDLLWAKTQLIETPPPAPGTGSRAQVREVA